MPKANPATVRYPPEELLFGSVIAAIASTKTSSLQDLLRIEPRVVCCTGVATGRIDNLYVHATLDTMTDVIDHNAGAGYAIDRTLPLQLWCRKAYRLWLENKTGGPLTNVVARDKYLVDDLNVVQKLRWGIPLDEEAKRIATKFSLAENLAAGRLYYRSPATSDQEVKRSAWVGRLMTAAVTSDEDIGVSITIPEGEKVVLTGVASEAPGAVTDEVYIKVNRDKDQADYLEINVAALPNSLDYFVPLWVPAVEEMTVRLVCTVAQVGGYRVRYQYIRAPLTLADKVKWDLSMTAGEMAVAQGLDLFDRIEAGIYPLGI